MNAHVMGNLPGLNYETFEGCKVGFINMPDSLWFVAQDIGDALMISYRNIVNNAKPGDDWKFEDLVIDEMARSVQIISTNGITFSLTKIGKQYRTDRPNDKPMRDRIGRLIRWARDLDSATSPVVTPTHSSAIAAAFETTVLPPSNLPAVSGSVSPFAFNGNQVRVVMRDGQPWFVLADVCRVLEHSNSRVAAQSLDDDERDVNIVYTPGGPQEMTVVSEPGLYSLIATSRKPEAKAFKRWVNHDVLPTIRKTGSYGTPAAIDFRDPALLLGVLTDLQSQVAESKALLLAANTKIAADQDKVSFADRHAVSEGLLGYQNAARSIDPLHIRRVMSWMKSKYLHYEGGALLPYTTYVKQGLFEITETLVDEKTRLRGWVTPKGRQTLHRLFWTNHMKKTAPLPFDVSHLVESDAQGDFDLDAAA